MRAAPPPAIMLLLGALTLSAGHQWLRTDDAAAWHGPGPTVRRAGRLPLLSYARRCSRATRERAADLFCPMQVSGCDGALWETEACTHGRWHPDTDLDSGRRRPVLLLVDSTFNDVHGLCGCGMRCVRLAGILLRYFSPCASA